jgi:hypothetical protein
VSNKLHQSKCYEYLILIFQSTCSSFTQNIQSIKGSVQSGLNEPFFGNVVLLSVKDSSFIKGTSFENAFVLNEINQPAVWLKITTLDFEDAFIKADYKWKMSKGIVAFEILVTDLQAKKKLSQNRTETEQRRIIDTLSKSEDTNEKIIAAYMSKNLPDV